MSLPEDRSKSDTLATLTRRSLIVGGGALVLTTAFIIPGQAEARVIRPSERLLSFEHMHTGEKVKVVYWKHGRYIRNSLKQINFIMRDHRINQVKAIDPKLLDILWNLQRKLETRQPFQIVSGYRSKATNNMLRAHSDNVAKRSLHIQGKAIDLRIEGRDTSRIRNAAIALRAGGVGYYPDAGFVHVDSGDIRTW